MTQKLHFGVYTLIFILLFLRFDWSRADSLYVVTAAGGHRQIEVFDTTRDTAIEHRALEPRMMPIGDAVRLFSAVPPWVADPSEETSDLRRRRKAGVKAVPVANYPEAITVAGRHLYGEVGDEEPGFLFEIPLSAAKHPKYYDTFQRHFTAIRAFNRRIFASYLNAGIWWAGPTPGPAHKIDDRQVGNARFLLMRGGEFRPNASLRSYFNTNHVAAMNDCCTALAIVSGGKTLYAAGEDADGRPALFIVDVATARLTEIVSLETRSDASIADLATASDGAVYSAVIANGGKTLSVYRFGGPDDRATTQSEIDLGSLSPDGERPVLRLAFGGNRLFLSIGDRLIALDSNDPRKTVATMTLPRPPAAIVATGDGRKVYLDLNGIVPVRLTGDDKFAADPPLILDGEPERIAVDAAAAR
jgi:hypothetical protein